MITKTKKLGRRFFIIPRAFQFPDASWLSGVSTAILHWRELHRPWQTWTPHRLCPRLSWSAQKRRERSCPHREQADVTISPAVQCLQPLQSFLPFHDSEPGKVYKISTIWHTDKQWEREREIYTLSLTRDWKQNFYTKKLRKTITTHTHNMDRVIQSQIGREGQKPGCVTRLSSMTICEGLHLNQHKHKVTMP